MNRFLLITLILVSNLQAQAGSKLCLNAVVLYESYLVGFIKAQRNNHSFITVENDKSKTTLRAGYLEGKGEKASELEGNVRADSMAFDHKFETLEHFRSRVGDYRDHTPVYSGYDDPARKNDFHTHWVHEKICQPIREEVIPLMKNYMRDWETNHGKYGRWHNNCTAFATDIYNRYTNDRISVRFNQPNLVEREIREAIRAGRRTIQDQHAGDYAPEFQGSPVVTE